MTAPRIVKFVQHPDDGSQEGDWDVFVDGVKICEARNDDMDIANNDFEPLWEALGITLTFENEP